MKNEYSLTRDVAATMIPAGSTTTLPAGSVVYVTQTLGGNVTVRTDAGLFRIEAGDADALGAEFGARPVATGKDVAATEGTFSESAVWDALKTCFDPEIPVNIVDLGLIYDLVIEPGTAGKNRVAVKMTLTAPGCGMGPVIANDAKAKIEALPAVESADVVIVWDPVWNPQMISAQGRQILGLE
jgi:probable FeS assembly SUF system protein SufT